MAAVSNSAIIFAISLCAILIISPANSLTCTSQNFTNNKLFSTCADLPQLTAYLHWTYNNTNSSLSIAYLAPPASPTGWVAWAINPTGRGMIGAQAFIAFNLNGIMTVKTYNITSLAPIVESKLAFDFWDVSGEESDGVITIFAAVKVPENTETVNQVWQVGSAVTDAGRPLQHAVDSPNLNSKGILSFGGTVAPPQNEAPPGQSVAPLSPMGKSPADSVIGKRNVGVILFSILFIGSFIIF